MLLLVSAADRAPRMAEADRRLRLAAAVSLSDPECRRRAQAEAAGGGDKEAVRAYFNSTGFERWRKIYGSATGWSWTSGRATRRRWPRRRGEPRAMVW